MHTESLSDSPSERLSFFYAQQIQKILACFTYLCYTIPMKHDFYKKIYEGNANFLSSRSFAKKALPIIDKILTGGFFVAYGVLCLYAITKKTGAVDMLPIFFAPMLGLLVVSALQLLIDKPRPYSENGAGITPLVKKNKEGHSFPSRHIACACVIATTCLPYLMPLGIFLYFLSVLLIYTRFSLGLHYLSDLFAGGILGVLCGLSVFLL